MPLPELSEAELAAVIAASRKGSTATVTLARRASNRSAPRIAKLDPASVAKPLAPRTPLPQAARTRAEAARGGSHALRWRSHPR